jgi:hypothetical protein
MILAVIILLLMGCQKDENPESSSGSSPTFIPPVHWVASSSEVINRHRGWLSPNGKQFAWFRVHADEDSEVCVATMTRILQDSEVALADSAECYGTSPAFAADTMLYWSPDSIAVAFHENVYRYYWEPDLWIADFERGTVTNLTDDGFSDNLILETEPYNVDMMPEWSPDGEKLYFWRWRYQSDPPDYRLYQYSLDERTFEVLANVSDLFQPLSIFDTENTSLNGHSDVSPDGKHLAVVVIGANNDDPRNGIWLIDLETDPNPRQLFTVAALRNHLSEDQDLADIRQIIWPLGVAWTADSNGLVIYMEISEISPSQEDAILYGTDEGALTTLAGNQAVNAERYEKGLLVNAVLSPDRHSVFALRKGDVLSVIALPVPPDREDPYMLVDELDYQQFLRLATGTGEDSVLINGVYVSLDEG